jgi:hypothetical protein
MVVARYLQRTPSPSGAAGSDLLVFDRFEKRPVFVAADVRRLTLSVLYKWSLLTSAATGWRRFEAVMRHPD